MDGPESRASAVLGLGAGLFILIVSRYRVDERGEDPYTPELVVASGALLLGLLLAVVGGVRVRREVSGR